MGLDGKEERLRKLVEEVIEESDKTTPKAKIRRHDIYEEAEDTLGLDMDYTEIDFVLDWMVQNNIINADYSASYMNPLLTLCNND